MNIGEVERTYELPREDEQPLTLPAEWEHEQEPVGAPA
jgi:hypothetical protein